VALRGLFSQNRLGDKPARLYVSNASVHLIHVQLHGVTARHALKDVKMGQTLSQEWMIKVTINWRLVDTSEAFYSTQTPFLKCQPVNQAALKVDRGLNGTYSLRRQMLVMNHHSFWFSQIVTSRRLYTALTARSICRC